MSEETDDGARFPGMVPDYIAEIDRRNPKVGEHGVRVVHVSLMRDMAGNSAIERAKETNQSTRAILLTRERLFDEIGNILEQFLPPFDEEASATGRARSEENDHDA